LERLQKAKSYLHRVLQDKDLKDAPILIMANKQDLEGAESAEKIYELLDLDQFIKSGSKKDIFY
jgi:signal recognition particle receptor subunit beta